MIDDILRFNIPNTSEEFNRFQEQGFGSVEFAFIVLKACYNIGAIYHGF